MLEKRVGGYVKRCQWMKGKVGELEAKNVLFLGMGLKIRALPAREQSGFPDTLLTLDPNGFHRVSFSLKDPEVSLFPDSPDKEARDELPDSIENGVLKGMLVPMFDGF